MIILDNFYPNLISAFRIAEYSYYMEKIKSCEVFSTNPKFNNHMQEYSDYYPMYSNKVKQYKSDNDYTCSLIYTIFLNNIYNFLPVIEKNNAPFVFTLYPGGGFWLKEEKSDKKLYRVCNSNLLKKIIVTQRITYDYLIEKNFCSSDKLEFIYGMISPEDFFKNNKIQKKYYKKDKNTFDICFVANKYMEKGIDKGYDVFIDVAKQLSSKSRNIMFHVVGGFDENDVNIKGIEDKVTFYGFRYKDFFMEFYSKMDCILSPNVPFVLFPGSFDGFPTGCCIEAGLAGVAVFCTDELHLNEEFTQHHDICIIPTNAEEIGNIILKYFNDLDRLYQLSKNCQESFLRVFSFEKQINSRYRILKKYL